MSNQFLKKEKKFTPLGERLLSAFESMEIIDKNDIAQILGFKYDKQLYKVLNGDQELKQSQLLEFREFTGFSIDWLLTGVDDSEDFDVELIVSPAQKMFVGMLEDVVMEIIGQNVPQIVRNEIAISNGEKLSKKSQIISGGMELATQSKRKILTEQDVNKDKQRKAG